MTIMRKTTVAYLIRLQNAWFGVFCRDCL